MFVSKQAGPSPTPCDGFGGALLVVWDVHKCRNQLQTDLVALKSELKADITSVKEEVQGLQSIFLGSAYVIMEGSLYGKQDAMKGWFVHLEKCLKSGGKGCAALKGIQQTVGKKE